MKKILNPFIGIFLMFFITSSAIKHAETKKRLFEKIIFVELSASEDSALFQPYSKAWDEHWNRSGNVDLSAHGTELMNSKKYSSSFENRDENLYTILHPMIINGTIQSFSPNDPESFGLGQSDDGELRYPIGNQEANETFLTSQNVRDELCYLLGKYGPMSDIPLVDDWGDYVIINLPDGTQSFKYPAPDYFWHTDKDIIKYKLRVSVLIDKKGKEKKRTIKAICPVVNRTDFDPSGNEMIVGETELLWLNFEELESTLEEAHYFDEKLKSVSYLNYFEDLVKNAPIK